VRSGEVGHGVPCVLKGEGAGQRHRQITGRGHLQFPAPGRARNGPLAGLLAPIATNPLPSPRAPTRRWSRIPGDLRGRKMLAGFARPRPTS